MIGALAIITDNYYRVYVIWNILAVLNNNLEYSLDDNHTVNLSFQSTTMHVFHATESINAVLAKT